MTSSHIEDPVRIENMHPTVSILMAVYNGEKYIRLAIDSVLSQELEAFELVIVDDCSTDGSAAIIHSYTDARIVYLRNPANLGQTKSLNVALAHARADLIGRIDADDIFLPGKLVRQRDFMVRHPEVAVCGTWAMRIDGQGQPTGVRRMPSDLLDIRFRICRTVPVCHVSVMMRRTAILSCGGYPERYHYAADFALWSRLLTDSLVITNIPEVLVQYREYGTSFGATAKLGDGGSESAEIIASNTRALGGLELSAEECRCISMFYSPAMGFTVLQLCTAFLNLRSLAKSVYGKIPLRVVVGLTGGLFWALTRRLTAGRQRESSGRDRREVLVALKAFYRHPEIVAAVFCASVMAPLGEQRVVRMKQFVMLRLARVRGRRFRNAR